MDTTDQRYLQILTLVYRFQQLTPAHLYFLLFNDFKTIQPTYTALRRLVQLGHLRRIDRLKPGGDKGGSGQHLYAITRPGWQLLHTDSPYRDIRAEDPHTLAIADCFQEFVTLERAGRLELEAYATEPETHFTVGKHYLKPDLYVELARPGRPLLRLLVEIDMSSQSKTDILRKQNRYYDASQAAGDSWPRSQGVLFVAVNDARADKLAQWVGLLDEHKRGLFLVRTAGKLSTGL